MFPSTACLLQHKIGANHAWGYDLVAACSGFTYALTTGAQMVASGAQPPRAGRRRRRDVEHHRLHRSHDLRAVRRRRRRGASSRRATTTASGSSISRTTSTAAAVRRCACRPAAAGCPASKDTVEQRQHYVQAGWADRLQVRRAQHRRGVPARFSSGTASSRDDIDLLRVAPGQPPDHPARRRRGSACRRRRSSSTSIGSATPRRRPFRWR